MPVLLNVYFPSVDGPAHLHNGNLLRQYWFYGDTYALRFFEINTGLSSNFIDHLWFAFTGLFLPSFLVEKSLLLFYVIALPCSFRFLVKRITPHRESALLASYLIFAFVYTFTFRIGFYNFSIGIPFYFWALGLWLRYREGLTARRIALLSFLATMAYLAHIFIFLLLCIVVFLNEVQMQFFSNEARKPFSERLKQGFVFMPGFILSALFFVSNSHFRHEPPRYLPKEQLVKMLTQVRPVITLNDAWERPYAVITGTVLLLLLLLVAIDFIRKRKAQRAEFRPYWAISVLVILVLFFFFPDWVASGGDISIRWALFFFYLLIVLIAAKGLPVKQLLLPVAVLVVAQLFCFRYHYNITKELSRDAETLAEAGSHIENDKVLLPLNFSYNWMHINFASYMALDRNIINLDNYEPTKPHFPLIWKKGEAVYDHMPGYGNRTPPCINIDAYEQSTHHRIDYLSCFYLSDSDDSCVANILNEIGKRFEPVYRSGPLQLYRRKPGT